jgi:hypothetical protein
VCGAVVFIFIHLFNHLMWSRCGASSVLLLWWTIVASDATTCDLACQHGSTCVVGTTSFADQQFDDGLYNPFENATTAQTSYCSCPHGWTGVLCDVEFASCDETRRC